MCRSILVVYFGCDEKHVEEVLKRCKPGLEYQLDMPMKELCTGWKMAEDWVMSRCRFCEEYFQARQTSVLRTRAASCTASAVPKVERGEIGNSGIREEPITPREKDGFKRTFFPKLPHK
jgi:hypothetical protein